MTNKQIAVIRQIKAVLKADSTFKYVGEYPDNVKNIGQNYPCVLVGEGDEEITTNSGRRTTDFMDISVWLYSDVAVSRINNILEYQSKIMDLVLDDQSLAETCVQIEPVGVEKGDYAPDIDLYNPGYYEPVTVRKINFTVRIDDVR